MGIKIAKAESELHKELEALIEPYFYYKHDEIYGKHWTESWIRPDYIIYPKESLIELGFPAKYFGIEVKSDTLHDGHKKQAIEIVAQAASYMQASYEIKKKKIYLEGVFIYPSIEVLVRGTTDGYGMFAELPDGNGQKYFQDGVIYGLKRLAGRLGVGEISHDNSELIMYVSACKYFTFYKNYKTEAYNNRMKKGGVQLLGKIQIGCELKKREK